MTREMNGELLAKIDADADAFEHDTDPDAVHYVRHQRPPKDPVYSLRIPADRVRQLRELAAARGIDASALARQWIVEQLDAAQKRRNRRAERWEHDLRATTENLRDQAEHFRRLLDERPGA